MRNDPREQFKSEPFKRSMTRRADSHDYCLPGFYMITLTRNPGFPDFSEISGGSASPKTILSPLGEAIEKLLPEFSAHCPSIRVLSYVIMPDHLHIVFQITEELERHLGHHIGAFKGGLFSSLSARITATTDSAAPGKAESLSRPLSAPPSALLPAKPFSLALA